MFFFAPFVSLATGLIFGMIPAIKASRASVAETLKEAGRTAGRNRRRVTVANTLLVAQVAFSFLLLVTAALFLRSIGRAYAMDPGFQTAHLAVFPANPGQPGYGKAQAKQYYEDVRMRAARVPGVETVSWASTCLCGPVAPTASRSKDARDATAPTRSAQVLNTVDRNYFETAGVVLVGGRAFSDIDQETSLPLP